MQLRAILLRANGMSQRAIAAELSVSVGSVNAWLSVQLQWPIKPNRLSELVFWAFIGFGVISAMRLVG
jgi:orotate phosphoribosyltransferase-like protein